MGQEIQQDGLGHQRIRAGDEGLGGDDRRGGAEDDCEGPKRLRQHEKEGIEIHDLGEPGIPPALNDPGPLPEVVQDQAQRHEGPAEVDDFLPHVAHIGIKGLRAGGGEEDTAEDHETQLVRGAEQDPDGIDRIEGFEHDRERENVRHAGDPQKGKPEQHDRPEGFSDPAGAGVLNRKERRDDDKRDDDDLPLAGAEKAVHALDAAKAFHGGGDRDRRRQNAVGQQGRSAQHRGNNQPLCTVTHQRVEGEDSALAVVVRLHGDQHILDRRQQCNGPDHQGEGSDDEIPVDLCDAPVALEDRLHDVHGRGADVAVDDADGHKEHAESKT